MKNRYVVVDIETTGNNSKKGARIIQFAAVVIEDTQIKETYSTFINPNQPIPLFIQELTGISDKCVQDAPPFSEVAGKINEMLQNAYFVAHNVSFDLSFLQDEFQRVGQPAFYGSVLDTVELARILLPTSDSFKLVDLAEQEGLAHVRPHQADSDALATAKLLLMLIDKLTKLPLVTLEKLNELSTRLKSDIHFLIEQILYEKRIHVEDLSTNIHIFRGLPFKKQWMDQNNNVESQSELVNFPILNKDKEQLLKGIFPQFELRQGQFDMMDCVYDSFVNQNHAVIEAGTGVGKSLGYLLPAVFFSLQNNERVIISTHTIQLQDQLMQKEIQYLKTIIPVPFTVELLKGRRHYISLWKFEQSLREEDDNYDIVLTKMQILVWLLETSTGDMDEINMSSGGYIFWNRVRNDEADYLEKKNPWIQHDYYLIARERAQKAKIIITNHSLLLTDMVSNKKILPNYEYVIVDEAHHLEKAASRHFGFQLDFISVRILLSKLGTSEQKQLYSKYKQLLQTYKIELNTKTNVMDQMINDLVYEIEILFKSMAVLALNATSKKGRSKASLRLKEEDQSSARKNVRYSAERVFDVGKSLFNAITEGVESLKGQIPNKKFLDQASFVEMQSFLLDFEELLHLIKHTCLTQEKGYASWIETDLRSVANSTIIYSQPLFVDQILMKKFFEQRKSIVLTSATITVNHSFDYIQKQLGLPNTVEFKKIPSPFQYDKKVKLLIPEDLPEINKVSLNEYCEAIASHIISMVDAANGRTLILFTSYEMLKITHDLIKESGMLEDFVLIAQGITSGSRSRLTKNFQRFEKAILFGTNSFWEGVDIPGEDLSSLMIVRLPFTPPDEPFTEAKVEYLKNTGINFFSYLSLPEAVLRFRQGFGRLIRTEEDKGVVVVFDRRILTTHYGKLFLTSIPKVDMETGPIDKMVDIILDWL